MRRMREGGRAHSLMMDTRPQLVGELNRGRLPGDLRRYLELCEARGLYQAVLEGGLC